MLIILFTLVPQSIAGAAGDNYGGFPQAHGVSSTIDLILELRLNACSFFLILYTDSLTFGIGQHNTSMFPLKHMHILLQF